MESTSVVTTVPSTTTTVASTTNPAARPTAAFLETAMDTVRNRSRDMVVSLRLHRDIIVDGWLDRFEDLAEQYLEDKRQVRAHVYRIRQSLSDRLEHARTTKECKAASFPQFSRLPAETRLQIWEEALPGARAIMLRSPYTTSDAMFRRRANFLPRIGGRRRSRHGASGPGHVRGSSEGGRAGNRDLGWTSSTPAPALLQVCSESRSVALKRYSLIFACEDGQARIYADLSRDIICLSGMEVKPRCNALWRRTTDLDQVRHLAVAAPACLGSWSSHYGRGFAHRLPPADLMGAQGFAALEDVVMVRSVRWQNGRLPRGARVDFDGWAEREEANEGLSRYHTRWRDGVMAIRHGRRKSSDQNRAEGQQQQQQQHQPDDNQQGHQEF